MTSNRETVSRLGLLEEFEKDNQLKRRISGEIEEWGGGIMKRIWPTSTAPFVRQQSVKCLHQPISTTFENANSSAIVASEEVQ
jgi:hypothetical protein